MFYFIVISFMNFHTVMILCKTLYSSVLAEVRGYCNKEKSIHWSHHDAPGRQMATLEFQGLTSNNCEPRVTQRNWTRAENLLEQRQKKEQVRPKLTHPHTVKETGPWKWDGRQLSYKSNTDDVHGERVAYCQRIPEECERKRKARLCSPEKGAKKWTV